MSAEIAPWYQAFDCQGDVEGILSLLEDRVARETNIRSYIQGRCVQILPGGNREFILYLGIRNCPRGFLPDSIMSRLTTLDKTSLPNPNGIRTRQIKFRRYTDCGNAEIRPIIQEWLDKTAGKIIYRSPEPPRLTDFDANSFSDDENLPFVAEADPVTYLLEETARYDRLLLLLSAKGLGSTEMFGGYCDALWADASQGSRPKSAHILRCLRLLGHIVTAPAGDYWRMLPALLVRVPVSEPGDASETVYTLVGKRDGILLSALREGLGILRSEPQSLGDGPATQSVYVNTPELKEAIYGLNIAMCDDYGACVEASVPPFATWRDSLRQFLPPTIHDYEPRLFNGDAFVRLPFEKAEGLYELWTLPQSESDSGRLWRTLFYDPATDTWLSGDWYGLRFLSHAARGSVGTIIHRDTEAVCSANCRLPEVYERALVIASGRLPNRRDNGRGAARLVYTGVPYDIASVIARKLDIGFVSTK